MHNISTDYAPMAIKYTAGEKHVVLIRVDIRHEIPGGGYLIASVRAINGLVFADNHPAELKQNASEYQHIFSHPGACRDRHAESGAYIMLIF